MPHGRYQGHLQTVECKAFREAMRETFIPCHECGNRASIPDHVPPVSTFPHPSLWQGVLLPHCKSCSNRQGAKQRWERAKTPQTSREW